MLSGERTRLGAQTERTGGKHQDLSLILVLFDMCLCMFYFGPNSKTTP